MRMAINNLSDKYVGYLDDLWTSAARLVACIWSQFIEDKCLQQASSLAFHTLLSLVPLSAVALFLLNTFGTVTDASSPLIVALRDNFLPRYGAEEIVAELSAFANKNLGGLGIGGFLLFLLVSTFLFINVEQHLNDIWGARRRLPIVQAFQKYAVFYTLLTVGPLLISLFFLTAKNWVFAHVFPWLLVYCLLFLIYLAMPNTAVKWSAALLGSLVAGILFQLARIAFGSYIGLVWKNYSDIYGAMALLIIFAIWTFVTWVVILLGAEVANVFQHFGKAGTQRALSQYNSNGYMNSVGIIALFLIVAERFANGKGACTAEQVASRTGVSQDVVQSNFERFKSAGLIYEVEGDTAGYLPARALSDITLAALVAAVEGEMTAHFVASVSSESGARVLDTLSASQREHLEKVTVASLV